MARVMIAVWVTGFEKVACTHLLQELAGCGLAAAKGATDRILAREAVVVSTASDDMAVELAARLVALGAHAKVMQ